MRHQQPIAQIVERVIDRPNQSPQEIKQLARLVKTQLQDLPIKFSLEDLERTAAEFKETYDRANRQLERFHSRVYQYGVTLAVLAGVAISSTLTFKVCCAISFMTFISWYLLRSRKIYDRQSLAGDRLATISIVARDYRVERLVARI